jgi:2,4-dienoyl-CoA reductase-like NADH-dependent reductase (Old Yellow Enzyme family)
MKLFEPLTIGKVTLKNRLVFAPYETNYATEEGVLTERQIEHYRKAAAGGVGLIVVEASNVNPDLSSRSTKFLLGIYSDKLIPGMEKLAQAIHKEGCKTILQIVDKSLLAKGMKPTDLQVSEIEKLIDYFVEGGVRAQKAGFDGVDYHMAAMYTVADFLSMKANKRKDEYGEGTEGKTKMAVEILRRTRDRVGKDFLLVPRFSGDELVLLGNTIKQTQEIGKLLEAAGADILDITAGGRREESDKSGEDFYSAHRSVPRDYMPDGVNVYIMEAIKKEVKVPVIAVGKIKTAELAEEILREGKADLIAMGRQIFADPDFPRKIQQKREKEVVPCLSCRYCHKLYFQDRPIACIHRVKESRQTDVKA